MSCWAGADKPTAQLLTSLYSQRLLVLVLSRFHSVLLLSSFRTVISFSVSMKRTGLSPRYSVRFSFNSLDILESQTKKERFQGKKKKRGYFFLPLSLSLSGTHPCFHSQRRAGSRSWPDRQQGWFHVTGTGAKGPESYSLHFLLIAHRSTVVRSPDHSRQRRRLPARVLLHPEDPPLLLLLTYISQDRTPLNLELF